VTHGFQDGRRRHVGNLSECCKMGNYHPILMQIGRQIKKNMLSSKFVIPEVMAKVQDGRCRPSENLSAFNKMCTYYPILMQIGTQSKKNMLRSKFVLPEV
jgi:hypothetical protein